MKIHQDVNSFTPGQGLHGNRTQPLPKNRTPENSPLRQPVSTSNRSVNRALSLSRMSMNIIQEAMVLSSQLRNIASRTIMTGELDKRQLEETMANLTSLSRTNQRTQQADVRTSPMTILPPPPVTTGDTEIDDLVRLGGRLEQGARVPPDSFDTIQGKLRGRLEISRERDFELSAKAGIPPAFNLDVETALRTTGVTGELIARKNGQALTAQGNLSGETAAAMLRN